MRAGRVGSDSGHLPPAPASPPERYPMAVSDDDLTWLTDQGHLTQAQATSLRTALQARRDARPPETVTRPAWSPRFDFLNVAYYFGALLVMGAMGFFMTLGWE